MMVIAASFLMTSNVQAANKSLSGVKTIKIELVDEAKGACWTNLKEVREYAEEKLRIQGINVVDDYPKSNGRVVFETGMYWLTVTVVGNRWYTDGSGPCTGFLRFSIHTHVWLDSVWHVAILEGSTTGAKNNTNFNNYIIQGLQSLFERL